LARRANGDVRKAGIARRLRSETGVTLKWIAEQLAMETWTYMANRLYQSKATSESNQQNELGLV
jgi:hypothetical protein